MRGNCYVYIDDNLADYLKWEYLSKSLEANVLDAWLQDRYVRSISHSKRKSVLCTDSATHWLLQYGVGQAEQMIKVEVI